MKKVYKRKVFPFGKNERRVSHRISSSHSIGIEVAEGNFARSEGDTSRLHVQGFVSGVNLEDVIKSLRDAFDVIEEYEPGERMYLSLGGTVGWSTKAPVDKEYYAKLEEKWYSLELPKKEEK
jgi:hypothetical protein